MIEGQVNDALEAVVRLVIQGPTGRTREIEAVVDTGFNGFLTLPAVLGEELGLNRFGSGSARLADGSVLRFEVHTVFVEWGGRRRYVNSYTTGNKPLIGTQLLHRHSLYSELVEGGRVAIDARG